MATTINPSDQTITQYNIQTGGANNLLNNVAPSSTSGIPVISQGSSSQPIFGTAVVAGGGTGQTTLTNHGVLVGAATTAITQLAAGSAGQVLQSGGASADPAYSTATYPSSSGGSGKILYDNGTNFVESIPTFPASASATSRKIVVSDGTNWVASTETWAIPGTSGNVLTSDGTNWTSAAAPGAGLLVASGQLTNTQIKNLHGTPVQAIAAPGSGKIISIVSSCLTMNYGGTNVFVAGAAQTIGLYYGTTTFTSTVLTNALIVASSSQAAITGIGLASSASTNTSNVAVNFYNAVATEISGNAGNDNTISYSILYRIVTIP